MASAPHAHAQKDVLILHTHIPGFLAPAAYVILWPLAAPVLFELAAIQHHSPESPLKIVTADNTTKKAPWWTAAVGTERLGIDALCI